MKFIQLAFKGNNEWWAYLVSLFVILFGWQIIGVIPLSVVAFMYAGDMGLFMEAADSAFTSLGMDSNLYLLLVISTFFFGFLFLIFSVKIIHKRSMKSVVTSRPSIDWSRVLYAFIVWFLIAAGMIVISYFLAPQDYIWNFKPERFFILLFISIFLLPIQTSFEELLFRGYLLQGFGTWFKVPMAALIITAVIFGLLHGLNPEVEKLGWTIMIFYMGTGFLLGLFTIMDEGTELALGFHAANNIVAAVLVTANWTVFQTDALLIDTSDPTLGMETFIPVFVLFPLVVMLFARKYKWTNWNEKLFGKVVNPEINTEESTTP